MKNILTAQQVAELLQVHVKTVHRLAKKGVIPGSKPGRSWRFSRDLVYQIINPKEQNGNRPALGVLEIRADGS